MLCENKLTNLVFKNQENSAKHNFLPFPSIFFLKKEKGKKMKANCIFALVSWFLRTRLVNLFSHNMSFVLYLAFMSLLIALY